MGPDDTTFMTNASTVADDSDDDTVEANDFLQDHLSQREADFIDQMKIDELQHVQHFFANKKFRNVVFSEYDCVPTTQEQAYEVENLPGSRHFFIVSVKVRSNLQQVHANHDRSDNVALPVPAFEVILHMLMKAAKERGTIPSAEKTANDALRCVYNRLWPTVPPGLLVRLLLFAAGTVFGAKALIRFASVESVQNALTHEFGKIGLKNGPGLTTPAEAPLSSSHLRSIAKRQWMENNNDNSDFDAHFEVDGFKPPRRKLGYRKWMLDASTAMTGRYNRNAKQILEVIGKPFDMWKERGDFENIDGETLLVELSDFREWYKGKMLADKENLIRDRKPVGIKRRIIPVCSSGKSVQLEAFRLASQRKAMDYTTRAFERSGRVDASKANFTATFIKPTFVKPNVSSRMVAGPSRIAANNKTPLPRQADEDDVVFVPSPFASTSRAAAGKPIRVYSVFARSSSSQATLPTRNEEDDVGFGSSRLSATPRPNAENPARRSSVLTSNSSSRATTANDEHKRVQQELLQKTEAQLEICERAKKTLQQEKDGISDTLQEAQEKITSLETDNAALKVQADAAQAKHQTEQQKAQDKIGSLEVDNERLKKEASEAMKKLEEEQKQAKDKDEQHKLAVQQLQDLANLSTTELEESKKKVSSLEAEIEGWKQKEAEWKKADDEREKANDEREKQYYDLVKESEQWKRKEAVLQQEKRDLTKALADSCEDFDNLSKEKAALASKSNENAGLHKKVAALEAQAKALTSEKGKLEAEKAELLKKNSSQETSLGECRAALQQKEVGLDAERQKLAKKNAEVHRLKKELETEETRLKNENAVLVARKKALDEKEAGLKKANVPPEKTTPYMTACSSQQAANALTYGTPKGSMLGSPPFKRPRPVASTANVGSSVSASTNAKKRRQDDKVSKSFSHSDAHRDEKENVDPPSLSASARPRSNVRSLRENPKKRSLDYDECISRRH